MAYFSYKQLASYLECPLQFKFLRIDKIPVEEHPRRSFLGNLLGTLVERVYVDRWWAEPDLLGRLMRELHVTARMLEQAEGIVWPPREREAVMQLAETTLPKIIATMKRERLVAPIVRTEDDLQIPIGTDTLLGRADLVFEHADGSTVVVDGKAGGTVGRFVKLDQLKLYVLGVYARSGKLPTKAGFWWFRHDLVTWHKTAVSPKALTAWVAEVTDAIRRLRANDWTPRPGAHCRYCDARSRCAVGQAKLLTRPLGNAETLAGESEGFASL